MGLCNVTYRNMNIVYCLKKYIMCTTIYTVECILIIAKIKIHNDIVIYNIPCDASREIVRRMGNIGVFLKVSMVGYCSIKLQKAANRSRC